MENNVVIQIGILLALVLNLGYTWFRDARQRAWAVRDAEILAASLAANQEALAKKVQADSLAIAAEKNAEAAAVAVKAIVDAKELAAETLRTAEKLAGEVKAALVESKTINTEATKEAKATYVVANSVNEKIAALYEDNKSIREKIMVFQKQLLTIMESISRSDEERVVAAKAMHDECEFNIKLKTALSEKMKELSSLASKRRKPK